MKNIKQKRAFSLLELVFVIVILGIVSSVGSTILAQLYENHIMQRAMHRVSSKTELAINQIANRITYRISNSVITRRAGTFDPLTNMIFNTTNTDRTVLEWIGYDNESFSAQRAPGWSGYCDLAATSAAGGISTPGSRLSFTNTVVENLSGGVNTPLALLFSLNGRPDGAIIQPGAQCFGYDGNTTCIHQVGRKDDTTLNTNRAANTANITDHYKLAWSAFAIVSVNEDALYNPGTRNGSEVAGATPRSFDLEFRYNYQPWAGTYYDDANTPRSTIIRNVTSFKYAELGGTMRIKLCATERVGDVGSSINVSVCKEKVVMR